MWAPGQAGKAVDEMRWMIIRAAALLVLLQFEIAPNLAIAEDVKRYQLRENEYLFVNGEEFREMHLEYSADGKAININGALYCYREHPVGCQSSQIAQLELGADWEQSPFVLNKMAKGLNADEVRRQFRSKAEEFYLFAVVARDRAASDDDWSREVSRWISDPVNLGIVKYAEVRPGGLSFKIWGALIPSGVGREDWIVESPAEVTIEETWKVLVEHFESTSTPQLMVVKRGGGAGFFGGQDVEARRAQILEMISTDGFVDGPIDRIMAAVLGLVGED